MGLFAVRSQTLGKRHICPQFAKSREAITSLRKIQGRFAVWSQTFGKMALLSSKKAELTLLLSSKIKMTLLSPQMTHPFFLKTLLSVILLQIQKQCSFEKKRQFCALALSLKISKLFIKSSQSSFQCLAKNELFSIGEFALKFPYFEI